jgi:hypothetical protein
LFAFLFSVSFLPVVTLGKERSDRKSPSELQYRLHLKLWGSRILLCENYFKFIVPARRIFASSASNFFTFVSVALRSPSLLLTDLLKRYKR